MYSCNGFLMSIISSIDIFILLYLYKTDETQAGRIKLMTLTSCYFIKQIRKCLRGAVLWKLRVCGVIVAAITSNFLHICDTFVVFLGLFCFSVQLLFGYFILRRTHTHTLCVGVSCGSTHLLSSHSQRSITPRYRYIY